MSVLVNLLPDLRQAKLREHRRKQLVSGISILIWIVCGAIFAILTIYEIGQKAIIAVTSNDITKNENSLKSMSGLTAALTASEQASSLPGLYSQRTFMSKFFTAYEAANPTNVALSSMTTDGSGNLTISGAAPDYASVARLARAMAADNVSFGQGSAAGNTPYFNTVNITSVSSSSGTVQFSITAVIDPSAESEVGSTSSTGSTTTTGSTGTTSGQ